jgi:hypothetical protein
MVDKKRFLRRKAEREQEQIEYEKKFTNYIKHLPVLIKAFYIARFGSGNVTFEGEGITMGVFVNPDLDDREANTFDDPYETMAMVGDPLLAFDEELDEGKLIDILNGDDDELVEELASFYALMGGES